MAPPFFYISDYHRGQARLLLDEENSRHMVQVLRMGVGERIQITDGKGTLLNAEILVAHKKKAEVSLVDQALIPRPVRKITVGISLLKNTERLEWFLEKAAEIGVQEIMPFISTRTEKKQFRAERLNTVLVSALLQSQQVWLPELHPPVSFLEMVRSCNQSQKFIAHCMGGARIMLADALNGSVPSQAILIGPEGDFTPEEVRLALEAKFLPVSLGETRLRSETAALVAATLLKML
jgi:16S rRNA (uracil1498-N3)-methyltransferase